MAPYDDMEPDWHPPEEPSAFEAEPVDSAQEMDSQAVPGDWEVRHVSSEEFTQAAAGMDLLVSSVDVGADVPPPDPQAWPGLEVEEPQQLDSRQEVAREPDIAQSPNVARVEPQEATVEPRPDAPDEPSPIVPPAASGPDAPDEPPSERAAPGVREPDAEGLGGMGVTQQEYEDFAADMAGRPKTFAEGEMDVSRRELRNEEKQRRQDARIATRRAQSPSEAQAIAGAERSRRRDTREGLSSEEIQRRHSMGEFEDGFGFPDNERIDAEPQPRPDDADLTKPPEREGDKPPEQKPRMSPMDDARGLAAPWQMPGGGIGGAEQLSEMKETFSRMLTVLEAIEEKLDIKSTWET